MDTVKIDPPMPDANHCPQCGTPLPRGALAGLCPACLLQMGAAADTVTDAKQKSFHPPSVAELAPLFPQLEILELIGKGGMGAVYKARQKQLDRFVALKILPPGIGDDPAFAERFAREAKALAKLNHPGIVTLYEFGNVAAAATSSPAPNTARLFYFLMEFVDGVNLRQLLAGSRVSAREALAIVPQICDALQFAHDQGIVHRDIKPENILLDRRGRVKVADFGLAKIIANDAPLSPSLSPSDGERVAQPGEGSPVFTEAGKVMGTPQYMSPEQIHAPGEVDHRADIYALGVVFYQMLTGELPGKQLQPPSTKVQIDVRLDEIVLRALEKKPELRYQQVSQVKTMVETIVASPEKSADGCQHNPVNTELWLALMDAGDYAQSWETAAPYFQRIISKEEWIGRLQKVRQPLGKVLSRKLISGKFTVPGNRFEAKYETSFDGLFAATETVTFAKQASGEWLATGYLIRPTVKEEPRFSRAAIWGACWAMFAVVGLATMFIVLHIRVENVSVGRSGLVLFITLPLALLVFSSPFGTTILGWVAVSQIRRSAGKIHGLWLAVFDGLLFPLLALNFLVGWVVWLALVAVASLIVRNGHGTPSTILVILFSMPIAILLNRFIIRRVWRAVNKDSAGVPLDEPGVAPGAMFNNSTNRPAAVKNKKLIWVSYACLLGVVLIQLFQWWGRYEPVGVWFQNPMDASVSGEYGEVLIHVTEVSQAGQVVVMKLACDTPYPERGLYVEYSGQLFDYPAAMASALPNLDCLVAPRFNNGYDRTLAGTTSLKGKPVYQIGLVTPDAATAAKVVEQVKKIHLGKPRGLDQKKCVLELFSLHRRVGKKTNGEPVTENLAALLVWQSEPISTVNRRPAAAPEHSFGPVMERVIMPFDENQAQACLDLGSGEFRSPAAALADGIRQLADNQSGQPFSDLNRPGDERSGWLKTSGVDLIGGLSPDGHAKFKYLGQPPHFQNGWTSFDRADPEKVVQLLQASPFYAGDKPNLPAVYVNDINPQLESVKNAQFILFRTHDGDVGILQVLGESISPHGVKIRYKLVQNLITTATPVSLPPAATPNLSFGPVMEHSLLFNTNGVTDAICLESNQVVTFPRIGKPPEGILFVDDTESNAIYLRGIWSLSIKPVKSHDWDILGPDENVKLAAASTNLVNIAFLKKTDLPETFAFRISTGLVGMLQVSSSATGENGVHIRYKFVTESSTNGLFPAAENEPVRPPDGYKPIPTEAAKLFYQSRELGFSMTSHSRSGESLTKSSLLEVTKLAAQQEEIGRKLAILLKGTSAEAARWRSAKAFMQSMQIDPNQDRKQWEQLRAEMQIAGFNVERLMADAGAADFIQPQANALQFGPWIEATLLHPSAGSNCCFGFDSVAMLTPPPEILAAMTVTNRPGNDFYEAMPESFFWAKYRSASKDTNALAHWLEGSSVDVVPLGSYGLVVFCPVHATMRTDETGNAREWEGQITPAWLLWKLHFTEKMNVYPLATNAYEVLTFPSGSAASTNALCFFQTRSGNLGILQITGFTDNPRGVKLRYKLVQNDSASKPTAVAPAFTLRWAAQGNGTDAVEFPLTPNDNARLRVAKTWVLETAMIDTVGWTAWNGENKKLLLILKNPDDALSLLKATSENLGQALVVVWQDKVIGLLPVTKPLGSALEIPLVMSDKEASALERGLKSLIEKPKPVATPAAPNLSFGQKSELLAELPKLQFLAWQDEWQTNRSGAVRHPDGSPVTAATELKWLDVVSAGGMDVSNLKLSPEPRFLKLWFSHPLLESGSVDNVILFDDHGQAIGLGAEGSASGASEEANQQNGNLGWHVKTFSPAFGANPPPHLKVLLFYTVGPLERTQNVPVTPNSSTVMSLEGDSQLNGMGQNVDGKTFVAVAVDARKLRQRKFGAVVVTKDGRELKATGGSTGGTTDRSGVMVNSFVFDIPLADAAKFIIGTRPIRTVEFTNVVLPKN